MAVAHVTLPRAATAPVAAPSRTYYKTKAEWAQSKADALASELRAFESKLADTAIRADWRRRKGLEQTVRQLTEERSSWISRARYYQDRGL